jgi:hypothetical protein
VEDDRVPEAADVMALADVDSVEAMPDRGASGATLERAVLRDGRRVVLKHLPREGDWLTRLSQGAERSRLLWDSGLLDRVGQHIDHAVLAMLRNGDHDIVVMDDVGDDLLPLGAALPAETIQRVLSGLARLHHAWEGQAPAGLCSPADRHRLAGPGFHRRDVGPHPCPFRDFVYTGWERFADLVADDVGKAVFAVLDDPVPLGRQLDAVDRPTLLHGDPKAGNLGLRGDRVVLIDWSELTGTGPAEMDLAWFVCTSTFALPRTGPWLVDALPDEVFTAYEVQAGRPLDPRALDLACIGALAQHGCVYAGFADATSKKGARAAQLLEWWVSRVRVALETWSPI